ncbi:MAG: hypothetical protein JRJ58_10505 [Deltaproteobacteria bacterium]|nr:hypothetical protein [Deltaproteobacteria bacterium]
MRLERDEKTHATGEAGQGPGLDAARRRDRLRPSSALDAAEATRSHARTARSFALGQQPDSAAQGRLEGWVDAVHAASRASTAGEAVSSGPNRD